MATQYDVRCPLLLSVEGVVIIFVGHRSPLLIYKGPDAGQAWLCCRRSPLVPPSAIAWHWPGCGPYAWVDGLEAGFWRRAWGDHLRRLLDGRRHLSYLRAADLAKAAHSRS